MKEILESCGMDIFTIAFLLIIMCVFIYIYKTMNSIIEKENKYINKNKDTFKKLSKASVTEQGTPANKVFKTLEESGIEINFLGMKGK